MASNLHHQSRSSGSSTSTGSTGSAYQTILDHVMTYPGSYEVPLRTMYNLNCAAGAQPAHRRASPPSSNNSTPETPQGSFAAVHPMQGDLLAQMASLRSQQPSLPPSFIVTFVLRCFPEQLHLVDFPQSLTGLDYLKDLETKRRREVNAAMERLGINREMLSEETASLATSYPGVCQWVKSIEEREVMLSALYSQVYVGLRRWILINELSLLPFNRHNCIAMLNTLYPPKLTTEPTKQLDRAALKVQRDGFFKWIGTVEKRGTGVMRTLIVQDKGDDETTGWPNVTRIMQHYLQVATSMINECLEITDVDDVMPQRSTKDLRDSRRKGKADSGISFGAVDHQQRPSTRGSGKEQEIIEEPVRPKTPSGTRSGTTLEKLARGLKAIGRSRTDVTGMINEDETPAASERPSRMLRKMRSFGSLDSRSRQRMETPAYDAEAMARQRQQFEALNASQQNFGKRSSNEV